MKVCCRCGEEKDLTEFHKNVRVKAGYRGVCKVCRKPEIKKRYEDTKVEMREYLKKWQAEHPGYAKEKIANWTKRNPGKRNSYTAARRARLARASPNWITPAMRREIAQIYEGCPADCEVDHVWPLQGDNFCGLHTPDNLQIVLKSDNRKKSNKSPLEWAQLPLKGFKYGESYL